jgi:uncharacterized SAM-binding protein YcdF (DUF218 family)
MRRRVLTGIGVALLLPVAGSLPVVASRLAVAAEHQHDSCRIEDCPAADAVVVLGGESLGYRWTTHPAGSRVDRGAALDRATRTPLVLSGGKAGATTEARLMQRTALALGVPAAAILLEEASRNTYDNARFVAAMLAGDRAPRIVLVTSASHMARARAAFVRQGMVVHPSAVRGQAGPACITAASAWQPDRIAFAQTRTVLVEYLALLVYRLRDRA